MSILLFSGNNPNFSDPTSFTGLKLWLDAKDASTITQSGGRVTQWNDKSGNSNHATASGTNRPYYLLDGGAGFPALNFIEDAVTFGNSNYMQTANTLNFDELTIIAVMRPNTAQGTFENYIGSNAGGNNFGLTQTVASTAYDMRISGSTDGVSALRGATGSMPASNYGVFSTRFSRSGGSFLNTIQTRHNKSIKKTTTCTGVVASLSGLIYLGRSGFNTAGTAANMDLAELIVYTRYLTDSEINAVETWLMG